MCGIVGFVSKIRQTDSNDTVLNQMISRVRHRGPDGSGKWFGENGKWNINLGHTRLAIIDIDGGRQPMAGPGSKHHLTFNGEIYNYPEIREELIEKGFHFATQSDSEVILQTFRDSDLDCLSKLNGMFAFALWDDSTGRLILARDRFGIKPLYYAALPDGGIAFASELTSLIAHPHLSRKLSLDGLASYFFLDYIQTPDTLIQGISKLQPGHHLVWSNGRIEAPKAFWNAPEPSVKTDKLCEKSLSTELMTLLERSVERQRIADVPLGSFLSGGIDSSAIAAIAQSQSAAPIKTFSIRFEEKDYDESAYARQVAKHIGSDHIEQTLSEDSLLDQLMPALLSLDEPMADPSLIPTSLLSRLAARHVKVALGGDGGDDLFGGYPTYKAHQLARIYSRLPASVRKKWIPDLISHLPASDRYQSLEWKLKRFALRWDDLAKKRHLRWMSNLDLSDLQLALGRGDLMPPILHSLPKATNEDRPDDLNAILNLDLQSYLPGSILTKVDRASMANGLEVRPPFLDNQLVDWALCLPAHYKVRGLTGKYILKHATRGLIPDQIIDRPKKGFGMPLARWLRGPLAPLLDQTLKNSTLWGSPSEPGPLNRNIFVQWKKEHDQKIADRSKPLWALIVLNIWLEKENLDART